MKKRFIATILIAAVSLTGCATKGEKEAKYFDFTASEFVEAMSDNFLLSLDYFTTIEDEENSSEMSTYLWHADDNIDNSFHYQIEYNDTTEKVSHISFFFDKSFKGDLEDARIYYLLHIGAIAEIIEPGIDTEVIFDAISNVNGINEDADGMATYKGKDFSLLAYCLDTSFNASFGPAESE